MSTRAWFRIHSFTGVVTGLLLFVICFSGTFAVFGYEIDWLVTPEQRVADGGAPAGWGEIESAAKQAFPGAEVSSITAPLNAHAVATVAMQEADGNTRLVWVDPYTATVTGSQNHAYGVQRFFRNFHRLLFLPGIGLYVVSAFAITMLVSVVAALVFYKRWWTRFFQFKRLRGRALWSEAHKLLGLWSLWFSVVIVVTGLWYLFESVRLDFVDGKVNYVGTGGYAVETVPEPEPSAAQPKDLGALVDRVRAAWPDLRIRQIGYGWHSGHDDAVYFGGQDSFPLVRPRANQIHLDRRTGDVLWMNRAEDLSPYWVWSNMADPLHFGDFGGWISKTVWFVFGLALSVLILTGTWLHARRLAKSSGSRHRWPGTMAAIGVSVVVLIASGVFGTLEFRFYGPEVAAAKTWPDLAPGAIAAIWGWIALTLGAIFFWTWLLWRAPLQTDAR